MDDSALLCVLADAGAIASISVESLNDAYSHALIRRIQTRKDGDKVIASQ